MIELPGQCEVNRVIPKKIFYEKVNISSAAKQEFIDKIEKIYWKYKISETKINISKTEEIEEIEVFEITLKEKVEIKNILKVITKEIPYPILFKITYGEEFMYAIKFQEDIFSSEWNTNIAFKIKGFDLKEVYENLVRQINNIQGNSQNIQVEVNKLKQSEAIQKAIQKLESKIKSEKQFNIKVEYNRQLIELKNKMKEFEENE